MMNLAAIPVILVIAVLLVYIFWRLMAPQKKKPDQRRFSIRKYRNGRTIDDIEETE
jgi:membrane protein implicated in regulation of membrane protease activity